MIKTLAPSLRALLEGLIDYAGLFPPAKLPLETTVKNYGDYSDSDYRWMLHRLVVPASDISKIPPELHSKLAVLAESDDERVGSLETNKVVRAVRPVYCEVAPDNLAELDSIKEAGCYAKIRMGGLKPEAIPAPHLVAAFIIACAERQLSFKATAGLHHPVRAEQALTYEADSPRAMMHGFVNVAMASAFAWRGEHDIQPVLEETDPFAFTFSDRAHWRDRSLTIEEVHRSRKEFMHSIGSCSFEEPLQDLQKLGLL